MVEEQGDGYRPKAVHRDEGPDDQPHPQLKFVGRRGQGVDGLQQAAHHVADHEDPEQLAVAQPKGEGALRPLGQLALVGGDGGLVALAHGLGGPAPQQVQMLPQLLQLLVVLQGGQVREGFQQPLEEGVGLQALLVLLLQPGSLPLPVLLRGLPPVVEGHGPGGQVAAQLVGPGPQLAGDVLQVFQLPVQAHDGHHRHHEVRQQQGPQHRQGRHAHRVGDVGGQPVEKGHDEPDDHRTGHGPHQGKLQTHIAV